MSAYGKNQILEPIATLSKIIMLCFKQSGSKISIRDHTIVICDVSRNYFGIKLIPQGIDRYLNSDSRNDLYVLNHVMHNFINWYVIPYKENKRLYNDLRNLAKYACVGFKKLQETYKDGNVVTTLQYYILILMSIANETFHHDMLYSGLLCSKVSYLDENYTENEKNNLVYSTILNVSRITSGIWEEDELHKICEKAEHFLKK